mmetsp:Transcript_3852/g.4918  ORF Transcript_3852/g.4918 Transcript_3852/m.4918 type:complete len:803 (+) Transcript_3852:109-2517(+)
MMQVPRTPSTMSTQSGYPGYTNSYAGMGTAGVSQYGQPAQLATNSSSWAVGKDPLPTVNSFGVMPGVYGSPATSGQMPTAAPSMLASTNSFSAAHANSFHTNSFGSLTSGPGLFGTAPFNLDRSTSGQIGGGEMPLLMGRYNFTFEAKPQGSATGTAGLTPPPGLGVASLGPTPNRLAMPSGSMAAEQPSMQQPPQRLETQPSWAMDAACLARVPPAIRGRKALLEKHESLSYGVSQEPMGCSLQLDDCVARCRREVQAIAEECRRRGQKYCDPDFPAHASALFANGRTPSRSSTSRPDVLPTQWRRASEGAVSGPGGQNYSPSKILSKLSGSLLTGDSAEVLVPGPFGTGYLLGALASLRTVGKEPKELIVFRDPEAGVYGVRLFKDGEWIYEILDDFLPVSREEKPACSRALRDGEVQDWPALLEKAYAKVHGCYEAISGGSELEALEETLGSGANCIQMREFPIWGELWQHLRSKRKRGYAMVAIRRGMEPSGQLLASGLISCLGYPVTRFELVDGEMLCELQNPWSAGTWMGRWGQGSPELDGASPSAMQHVLESRPEHGSKRFWMSIQDFCMNFTEVCEARVIPPHWHVAAVTSSTERPSYPLISVSAPTQALFVLSQKDRHWDQHEQYQNGVGLRIYRCRVVAPPRNAVGVRQNVSSPFRNLELLAKRDLTRAHCAVVEVAKLEPSCLYIAVIDSEYRSEQLLLHVYTTCLPRFRELSSPESSYLLQAQEEAPAAADHDSFSSQGSVDYTGPRSIDYSEFRSEEGWRDLGDEGGAMHLPRILQACMTTCTGLKKHC